MSRIMYSQLVIEAKYNMIIRGLEYQHKTILYHSKGVHFVFWQHDFTLYCLLHVYLNDYLKQ